MPRRVTQAMGRALDRAGVRVTPGVTGPYGQPNHFDHPDRDVRRYVVRWLCTFADLGGRAIGTQFADFIRRDPDDPA